MAATGPRSVHQSHEGVRLAQAIINIALLTGNIGRPGTGANTTNLLGGHDFTSEPHRAKVAGILGDGEPDEIA